MICLRETSSTAADKASPCNLHYTYDELTTNTDILGVATLQSGSSSLPNKVILYRMKMYTEFNLAILPRKVKFTELNISKSLFYNFSYIKPSMNSSENFLPVGYNKLEYSLAERLTLPYLESAIFLLILTNLSLNFTSCG